MTHPITPPHELVQQWRNLPEYVSQLQTMSTVTITTERLQHIATQAARWGADQELEACCEWLVRNYNYPEAGNPLHTARRPKPPSLKEQALDRCNDYIDPDGIIRRALEALPDG